MSTGYVTRASRDTAILDNWENAVSITCSTVWIHLYYQRKRQVHRKIRGSQLRGFYYQYTGVITNLFQSKGTIFRQYRYPTLLRRYTGWWLFYTQGINKIMETLHKQMNKTVCVNCTERTLVVFFIILVCLCCIVPGSMHYRFCLVTGSYESTVKWETCQIFKEERLLMLI